MPLAPSLRIVVLGTGDFALPMFDLLCETGHLVAALVTQPDRPQGRKQELIPSRIKQSATTRGIPILQPERVNGDEGVASIRRLAPDLLVTAAYGQILSPELLTIPRLGGINLHGSVLPAYRGAAPVARAIQNGESETGVTVIRMTPRIDAGGMIAVARTAIDPDETAGELEERLAQLGAPLIVEAIGRLIDGTASVIPQDRSLVTKAPKLTKDDGVISWSLSARAIHDLVRAMQPWPQAVTSWAAAGEPAKAPARLIVQRTSVAEDVPAQAEDQAAPGLVLEATGGRLAVATGRGILRLERVQVPGKKPMSAADFLLGNRVRPGDRMTS
jgi:methionyl-tRNA formyltransferase